MFIVKHKKGDKLNLFEKALGLFIFGFIITLFLCSAIAPLVEYIFYIIPILLICFSPFAYGIFSGWRIKHKEKLFRATLLNPDKNGLYPVPTEPKYISLQQPVLEIAQIYHGNRQPSVPHSFTFAPRLTSNAQTSEREQIGIDSTIIGLPAYKDLPFKSGEILLGYTEQVPKYVQRETLISTLVGGSTNTGKSTLMRLILSQYLNQDCQISIIDPHYMAGKDSLGKSFDFCKNLWSPTAYEKGDILATLKLFDSEIERRLKGSGETKPLILVVDEFTGLLSNEDIAEPLIKLITKISSQSRKVFVYTFCIAQQFHKDLVPSTIRNGFTHFLSTKSRLEVAQLLTGSKIFAKEVESITGYQCVYMGLFGTPERLYVPNVTQKDIEECFNLTRVNSSSVSSSVSSSKDAYVIAMLKLGKSTGDIVRECYGIEGRGRGYQDSVVDIRRIISENLK